jgi:hypothetical protein
VIYTLAWVLAAEASGNGSQILDFAQYGVLGLLVLSFIFGWIVPKPTHDALRQDLERREAQLDALIATYEKEIIPVLTEVNAKLFELTGSPTNRRPR